MIKLWNGDDSFLRDIVHTLKAETFSQLLSPFPARIFPYFLVYNGGAAHCPSPILLPRSFVKRTIYPIYLAMLVQKSRIRFVNFLDLSIRFIESFNLYISSRFIIILKDEVKRKIIHFYILWRIYELCGILIYVYIYFFIFIYTCLCENTINCKFFLRFIS